MFHDLTVEESLKKLKTTINGLAITEVKKRQEKYGFNQIAKERPLSALIIFLNQFKNPLTYILFGAGTISFFLGEYIDGSVILGSILVNAIIGFFQEKKANSALTKLKNLITHKVIVLREGKKHEVESSEVTIGDVLVLKAGDQTVADARIIKSSDLQVNEASLTGESLPIYKTAEKLKSDTILADRRNMVYSGTVVVAGFALAVVTAIGQETEIGKISQLLKDAKTISTPLQNRLTDLSRLLGSIMVIISILVVIFGVWQGRGFWEMFVVAVALAVASIPEGLVVAVTVILTLGMKRILQERALVRRLMATETLGSTTVICTDKTGTLTTGKMTVENIWFSEKTYNAKTFLEKEKKSSELNLITKISVLCNNGDIENPQDPSEKWKLVGAPTETALLSFSALAGELREKFLVQEPEIFQLPFSSEQKFMITIHKQGDGYVLYEKGAPERLLDKATHYWNNGKVELLTKEIKQRWLAQYEKFTLSGLRVLALAYRPLIKEEVVNGRPLNWQKLDQQLIMMALITISDPLREESKETIQICRQAGIRSIIITGDHKLTAAAIAQQLGFSIQESLIMTGDALEIIDDKALREVVKTVNIYARVSPQHKLRIVKALQDNGEVVAMTGDGLNDSPALKSANIGVCLGSGTDIAKESADLVLLDDNFKVIVSAVEQGRIIFANIKKAITFLVSDSFSEIILVAGSIFLGLPLAILPTQILWVNIINDGLPSFFSAFEKGEKGVMKEKPRPQNEPIIDKRMKITIFGVGFVRDIILLLIFVYLTKQGYNEVVLRSFVFAILGTKSAISILSLRSLKQYIWQLNIFNNRYAVVAIITSLLLCVLAIYTPVLQNILRTTALSAKAWLGILAFAIFNLILLESVKFFYNRKILAIK